MVIELKWIAEGQGDAVAQPAAASAGSRIRERIWMLVALLAIVAIAPFVLFRSPSGDISAVTFQITAPPGSRLLLMNFAVAPDGRRIAYFISTQPSPSAEEKRTLWLRSLDSLTPMRLAETIAGRSLFWSPDGTRITYAAFEPGASKGDFYEKSSGGATPEQLLYKSDGLKEPEDFSPDSRSLVFAVLAGLRW